MKKSTVKSKFRMPGSIGENTLHFQMKAMKIDFVREHKFHATRKWRFDFAIPSIMLAIEIEGGIFTNGRHVRPMGYKNDMTKYNAASVDGWKVLRFTASEVKKGEALQTIMKVLAEKSTPQS